MSGTRSHSPQEPATSAESPGRADEALLVVAHGEAAGPGANILATELARRIKRSNRFGEVELAFIRGEPSIEEVAARIRCSRLRIYPLFMSDGYYVRDAIPRRLGLEDGVDVFGHAVTIDEPFGNNKALPQLLVSAAAEFAGEKSVDLSAATLMLVAHGSQKSAYSRDAALRMRDQIAAFNIFGAVEVSFIEEEPFFASVLPHAARPMLVLGLLAGEGMHATDDIKGAIAALDDNQVLLVERFGGYAPVVEMIANGLIST